VLGLISATIFTPFTSGMTALHDLDQPSYAPKLMPLDLYLNHRGPRAKSRGSSYPDHRLRSALKRRGGRPAFGTIPTGAENGRKNAIPSSTGGQPPVAL
jgi:hypothetical protein